MTNEVWLEHFLVQIDRELHSLPVGQRAEVILEIKTQLQQASAQHPARKFQDILRDFGTPSAVAERYLKARGLTYMPAPRKPGRWLKALVFSVAAMFIFFIVGMVLTIWYFSPIVSFATFDFKDLEELERMVLNVEEEMPETQQGQAELQGARSISVSFSNGKLSFKPSATARLIWSCQGVQPSIEKIKDQLHVRLNATFASCKLQVPTTEGGLEITGANGKVAMYQPQMPTSLDLVNGTVELQPDPARSYDYDIRVQEGSQDDFLSRNDAKAIPLKVYVRNGMVSRIP